MAKYKQFWKPFKKPLKNAVGAPLPAAAAVVTPPSIVVDSQEALPTIPAPEFWPDNQLGDSQLYPPAPAPTQLDTSEIAASPMTSAPLPSGISAAAAAVPQVAMAPPCATWVASRETMQKYQAENKSAIELEDGLRARMMKMSDLELERLAEHAKIHHLFAKYRLRVKNEFGVETMNELPPFGDGDLFEELIGWHVWLHANAPNDALQTTRPPALRSTTRPAVKAPAEVSPPAGTNRCQVCCTCGRFSARSAKDDDGTTAAASDTLPILSS